MKEPHFSKSLLEQLGAAPVLTLREGDRLVVMSDFHMGTGGRRDDLSQNQKLLEEVLESYYLPRGWILVLNGDIEELQRFSLPDVMAHWEKMYSLFDRFASEGRLYKTIGNHDEELRSHPDYPYPILDALRVETASLPLFIYHGHQVSKMFVKYNSFIRAFIRYVMKPVGIKNVSVSKDRRKRFFVERRVYAFSRRHGIVSILGHTHRPLFESLSKYDYLKYETERLCREYPRAGSEEKLAIASRVRTIHREFRKIRRKDKRRSLLKSLYGDDLLVPCVFNSGCAIGKKGITALEIDRDRISLVYWFTAGQEKKYVRRGDYAVENLEGTSRRRVVLNTDRLDYVRARIDLLA